MAKERRVALVTGAYRGLGFETCRELAAKGWQVIVTARKADKGRAAAEKLGESADFVELDVTDDKSVAAAASQVVERYGRLDALVNNAGIFPNAGEGKKGLDESTESILEAFETNTLGPLRVARAFIPLMKKNRFGRIVNVSSGMGQLSEMRGGNPAYRLSKTALNAVTRILSEELKGTGILVNSVCPGWVKTEMGGPEAPRSLEQGAETIVWLVTLPDEGPSGLFFRDKEQLPW